MTFMVYSWAAEDMRRVTATRTQYDATFKQTADIFILFIYFRKSLLRILSRPFLF